MLFATQGAYKGVRAAETAALVAWSAVANGDRLGGLVFSGAEHHEQRPALGVRAALRLLQTIASESLWEPAGGDAVSEVDAEHALLRLTRVARPGSLIFLLSDFDAFDTPAAAQLAQLTRHNDVVLISVHDPLEADLPPAGRYRVSDGRRILSVESGDPQRRERYRRHFAARQTQLQGFCRDHGVTLLSLSTADEPLAVLQRGLGLRR